MRRILAALKKVEITGRISLETGGVTMTASSGETVVVEVFVVISLAVLVQVMQHRDLIAPEHVNKTTDNFQTERLIQPGRKTLPGQLLQFLVNTADPPDIAMDGADGRVAILKEIVTTG